MKYRLKFEKNITRWDEAIPLGNGRIGSLVWGGPSALRFSLDRTDIWDRSTPMYTEREDFTYANLVKLAKDGKTGEIRELFDAPYQCPTPTKLPSGKLIFCFSDGDHVCSELDLETAEAKFAIVSEKGTSMVEAAIVDSFCHAVTKTGMIRVSASADSFRVKLEHPDFGRPEEEEEQVYDPKHREISQGSLKKLHYPEAESGMRTVSEMTENGSRRKFQFSWFTQKVDSAFSYGIVVGKTEDRENTEIFYRIVTSEDGDGWLEDAIDVLQSELGDGYEKCRITHRAWWTAYWKKSRIRVPDPMFEKQWYLTNYLFASCSRKGEYPMPLQGVWTADDGKLPPWKGDYHNDLNTQLSYTHFYKANHLEEGESFLDFLWDQRDAAKQFAEKFYQTKGICLPGVMTIDGKPLGGWPMYSLSPTNQIWLCQSFDLYYRYTGDRTFLRERTWIYFQETEQCIRGLLQKNEVGDYVLPVSSSPEIHDDEAEAWLTPNSHYDLALLRYLYQTLIRFAGELGERPKKEWEEILSHLPEFSVNERGVLMLSPDESLEESHRHLSNALAICPLHLYRYEREDDRKIIDAVVEDYERLGSGMWVGFSFAWMAHLYAVQGNGEGAYEQLRIFWESFCSPNGFHLNGDYKRRGYTTFHYRPFTLEANMYATDGLQEMLLQTRKGRIDLFPAVPESWKGKEEETAFEHFRGEGGILVSARMKGGKDCQARLEAEQEQEVSLWFNGRERKLFLKAGEIRTVDFGADDLSAENQ